MLTFPNGDFGVFGPAAKPRHKGKCKAGFKRLSGKCRPKRVTYGRGSISFAAAGTARTPAVGRDSFQPPPRALPTDAASAYAASNRFLWLRLSKFLNPWIRIASFGLSEPIPRRPRLPSGEIK